MADEAKPGTTPLSAPIEAVRSTAKWYLAGFAAVGAALVTAIGLKAPDPASDNLGWVLIVLIAAFAGLAVSMWGVALLLLPVDVTLAEANDDPVVRPQLEANREILAPYVNLGQLTDARLADQEAYTTAWTAWNADPTADTANALKIARLKLSLTNPIVDRTLGWASFYTVQHHYQRQMTQKVLPGLASAATALVIYLLINTAPDAAPTVGGKDLSGRDFSGLVLNGFNFKDADLSEADLSKTELIGASLAGADLSGADLSGANLMNASLAGATLTDAKYAATTCPDGTSSSDHAETCEGHMTRSAPDTDE